MVTLRYYEWALDRVNYIAELLSKIIIISVSITFSCKTQAEVTNMESEWKFQQNHLIKNALLS